jgi:caspase 7
LRNLHFNVEIFKDCTRRELLEKVRQISTLDHKDYDCLLIAILSHGELGFLYSRDSHYKLDEVTGNFTADRCPSLAGKPKVKILNFT